MTKITPKHLVQNQVPKFVAENNPLFLKFFEYYYEYLETTKIQDIIQDIKKYGDIDTVEESFLYSFFEELRLIPKRTEADIRLVAKHIFDLYKAKGTEEAMKLLFRIVFGEEINITYPRDNILIPSSGKWIQDVVFSSTKISGDILSTSNKFVVDSVDGKYELQIQKFENNIENNKCRFFADQNGRKITLNDSQKISIYTNNTLNYVGKIIKTNPTKLKVIDSGRYWQVGQVFRIPGTIKDTICRVSSVDIGGQLKNIEIIEYGYGHLPSQNIILSPFIYKPSESYSEIYSILNEFGGKDYLLKIFDTINYISENIIGYSNDQKYVLEGYVLRGYIKRLAIKHSDMFIDQELSHINQKITHQQWLDSLTKIELQDSYVEKCRGYYGDVLGQLSNESIKIQDSKYYQLFSYVIQTMQSIGDYENVHSLFHPSGMKYFAEKNLVSNLNCIPTIETTVATDNIYLKDVFSTNETISLV